MFYFYFPFIKEFIFLLGSYSVNIKVNHTALVNLTIQMVFITVITEMYFLIHIPYFLTHSGNDIDRKNYTVKMHKFCQKIINLL